MRYLALIVLNIPIILVAILNITTKYKLGKMSRRRFTTQLIIWLTILVVVTAAFPIYNYLNNLPIFEAGDLSLLDIVQTTAIILLIYVINTLRQKNEITERRLRDLHQEMSIKLSTGNNGKN